VGFGNVKVIEKPKFNFEIFGSKAWNDNKGTCWNGFWEASRIQNKGILLN